MLFGEDENGLAFSPSARLPVTLPTRDNELNFTAEQWPGVVGRNGTSDCTFKRHCPDPTDNNCAVQPAEAWCQFANYSEGLQVGYRWYHAHSIQPAFPFGAGESFSTFHYDQLEVTPRFVSFTVTNNGSFPAAEVAQLYLTYPASAGEPPHQLKAFQKTEILSPGDVTTVRMEITDRTYSVWSVDLHAWQVPKGLFVLSVGGSSADSRLSATVSRGSAPQVASVGTPQQWSDGLKTDDVLGKPVPPAATAAQVTLPPQSALVLVAARSLVDSRLSASVSRGHKNDDAAVPSGEVAGFHVDIETCSGNIGKAHHGNTAAQQREACVSFFGKLENISRAAAAISTTLPRPLTLAVDTGTAWACGEEPASGCINITYNGKSKPVSQHVIDLSNTAVLMDYTRDPEMVYSRALPYLSYADALADGEPRVRVGVAIGVG